MSPLAYLGLLLSPSTTAGALVVFISWRDRRRERRAREAQLAGFRPEDVEEIRERLARVEAIHRPDNVIPFPKGRR